MGSTIGATCSGDTYWVSRRTFGGQPFPGRDGRAPRRRVARPARGHCDTIVSVCPPDRAMAVAHSVATAGFGASTSTPTPCRRSPRRRSARSSTATSTAGSSDRPAERAGSDPLYLSGDEAGSSPDVGTARCSTSARSTAASAPRRRSRCCSPAGRRARARCCWHSTRRPMPTVSADALQRRVGDLDPRSSRPVAANGVRERRRRRGDSKVRCTRSPTRSRRADLPSRVPRECCRHLPAIGRVQGRRAAARARRRDRGTTRRRIAIGRSTGAAPAAHPV